jgi:tRNA threonylcarbamoyl adenosine modification protein YeaZ
LSGNPPEAVLVVDTCSARCLVAAARGAEVVVSLEWQCGRNQSQDLLPAIADVLERAAIRRDGLEAVVVTVGPGSYAGLRVGVSAARGLALALGIPCVGVERLAADALGPLGLGFAEVSVAMQAGRSQYGLARYRLVDGLPQATEEPRPATEEELTRAGAPHGEGPGTIPWRRRAEDILAIGLRYLEDADVHPPKPIYLREPAITSPTRSPF